MNGLPCWTIHVLEIGRLARAHRRAKLSTRVISRVPPSGLASLTIPLTTLWVGQYNIRSHV
eukprot:2818958-Pyramimonas_sp.AAC.1